MTAKSRPSCTILCGPNGSGKPTLFENLRPDGRFINADNVARQISSDKPEAVSLAAGRKVLRLLSRLLAQRQSFIYETTLSSNQSLSLMRQCQNAGYAIELVFVILRNVELNILRISERVARGGHGIPEEVRRRHETAFRQLPKAIALADKVLMFDNSEVSYDLLLELDDKAIRETHLQLTLPHHVRLARAVSEGSGLELASLLVAPR